MKTPGGRKVILVTTGFPPVPSGGRELLSKLNHDALLELCGGGLETVALERTGIATPGAVLAAFRGMIDGVSEASIARVLGKLKRAGEATVFVDGSNLGEVVRRVKLESPRTRVVTFCHNVESRFFWGAFLTTRSPRALAVAVANFLAERKAVRLSDDVVCLSGRDSRLLGRLYGREATAISPMAVADRAHRAAVDDGAPEAPPFALFVGGTFYGNVDGMRWYSRRVAPLVDVKVCVVGRGFEEFRADIERPGRVEVVGAVEDLSDWYRRARFVIAPILDGSGMKTKVAEALMFGKRVVGTPEAFAGYDDLAGEGGWMCSTPAAFAAAMRTASREASPYDPALRAIYERRYSFAAARKRLEAILHA